MSRAVNSAIWTIEAALADGSARKTFIVAHEAWYAGAQPPPGPGETGRSISVIVQALTADGHDNGTLGEFQIVEHSLTRRGDLYWRLCLFDDAWALLRVDSELFAAIARLAGPTEERLRELLAEAGYVDVTERERVSS